MMSSRILEKIPSRNYDAGMDRKPYPSETQDRFILRLPDGLRDRVAAAAEEAGRSMNAEFVRRIERSFEAPEEALQLPVELRQKMQAHAEEFGRTFAEEIVQRLADSFDWDEYFLPVRLQREITAYRKANDLESKEAFERLVSAGLHKDAPCVLVLTLDADMDLEKFVASLEEAKARLPKGTVVLVEQHPIETPRHGTPKKSRRKLDV
jgi:predicted DNA-binding protein